MMNDDFPSLPSLRSVIDAHDLGARKSLAQHFLLDMNINRKIIRIANIKPEDHIIEIGPGPGGLTRAILEMGSDVSVIERDHRCLEILQNLSKFYPDKINIHNNDALTINFENLITDITNTGKDTHIISNLPYNISTELLVRWLLLPPQRWQSMTLMFQKEVADRILAMPGTKSYGRLSILSQIMAHPKKNFDLPPQAFTPPPKVHSSIVHFAPPQDYFEDVSILEKITRAAFSQRRKMLRSCLRALLQDNLNQILEKADIAPTARAEEIDIAGFQKLTRVAAPYLK